MNEDKHGELLCMADFTAGKIDHKAVHLNQVKGGTGAIGERGAAIMAVTNTTLAGIIELLQDLDQRSLDIVYQFIKSLL